MIEDEDDHDAAYLQLLAEIDRTEEQDARVCSHEASHAIARILQGRGGTEHSDWSVTVTPTAEYEGAVLGSKRREAFKTRVTDASDIRKALQPTMPQPGEDVCAASDIFSNVYAEIVEMVSGRVGEELLHGSASAGFADDYRQARELAALFCRTEEAIDSFIGHCEIAARDLLMPFGYLIINLGVVLKITRDLSGAEVNNVVASTAARWELATEQAERCAWRLRIKNAQQFAAIAEVMHRG
jgi:hypothetical protein